MSPLEEVRMKRRIVAVVLLIMMIVASTGCQIQIFPKSDALDAEDVSESTSEHTNTPDSVQKKDSSTKEDVNNSASDLFDETCWIWGTGVTIGSTFYVRFHTNGTMECLAMNDTSCEEINSYSYTYDNGQLWIETTPYRDIAMTYHLKSDGIFESDQKVPSQSVMDYMTISPDPNRNFETRIRAQRDFQDLLMNGVWFYANDMSGTVTRYVFYSDGTVMSSVVHFMDEYEANGHTRYRSYSYDDPETLLYHAYGYDQMMDLRLAQMDGNLSSWKYHRDLDVLYNTWYNDISDSNITEYMIHYPSDPGADTLQNDIIHYLDASMSSKVF